MNESIEIDVLLFRLIRISVGIWHINGRQKQNNITFIPLMKFIAIYAIPPDHQTHTPNIKILFAMVLVLAFSLCLCLLKSNQNNHSQTVKYWHFPETEKYNNEIDFP